ncbi:sensor histidine kinase [Herbiconiux sp. P15]|uniref:sensor histidine kinase n=1 Tax=Herbiconiux liukaitaii TaxID=3342799 RepID=UPI0035B94A39
MSASGGITTRAAVPLSRRKIERVLARLQGVFGLTFAVLSLPVLSSSIHTLKPEWAFGVAIALFGAISVAFVCSFVGRGVRIAMGAVACVFVVTLTLWPFAVRSPEAAIGTQPWLWYIVIVAVGAAAYAFPTFWAAVYTVAVPAIFAVLEVLPAGGGVSVPLALLDAIYALLLGAFLVFVIAALRQTASRVDQAQATAVARYAEAAKRAATEQERTRVDTVIHDRVLSTLLAAARGTTPADRRMTVQMAERALVALQSADAETEASPDLPATVLVERCQALADALAADIGFSAQGSFDQVVPARVVEGIYSATVQAIVNSMQHAGFTDERGRHVVRTISMLGDPDEGLTLVISDTGQGFDPAGVPADRLGVRISIRERIDSVGGSVQVRSVPGAGTSVIIEWRADRRGEAFA